MNRDSVPSADSSFAGVTLQNGDGGRGGSQPETSPSIRYRPEIDGMRALAVVRVVIYHFLPHAMPGGLTGVDVFFVISGYLSSLILIKPSHARVAVVLRTFLCPTD